MRDPDIIARRMFGQSSDSVAAGTCRRLWQAVAAPAGRFAVALMMMHAAFSACTQPDDPLSRVKDATEPLNDYRLGEVVEFGGGGRSDMYKRGGWSVTEETFTWTNAKTAELSFTIAPTRQPLKLAMRLQAFTVKWPPVPLRAVEGMTACDACALQAEARLPMWVNPPWLGDVGFQAVEVFANNEKIADWQVSDHQDEYVALIPVDVANHVELVIELRIPDAMSPKRIGAGTDSRTLGVACSQLVISDIP